MHLNWKLTSLWLVALESSSGYGLVTPMATQLAKMARRMKISKGLRGAVKGTVSNKQGTHAHHSQDCRETHKKLCQGYFHSTRASAAMRMGLLRVRQQRARGALRADLFACIAFLAPPPLFLEEPVDPRVSDFPPSPPGGASVQKIRAVIMLLSVK